MLLRFSRSTHTNWVSIFTWFRKRSLHSNQLTGITAKVAAEDLYFFTIVLFFSFAILSLSKGCSPNTKVFSADLHSLPSRNPGISKFLRRILRSTRIRFQILRKYVVANDIFSECHMGLLRSCLSWSTGPILTQQVSYWTHNRNLRNVLVT